MQLLFMEATTELFELFVPGLDLEIDVSAAFMMNVAIASVLSSSKFMVERNCA